MTYVVSPSLFFVRKIATKLEFLQLEKDLTAYGNAKENVETSVNLKPGTIARDDIIRDRISIVFIILQMIYVSLNNGKISGFEDA